MIAAAVFPNITVDVTADLPAAATRPQSVTLQQGARYELRCSAPVAVRAGAGAVVDVRRDLIVEADTPLLFTADAVSLSLIAASTSDAVAWLRRCPEVD